MKTKPKAKLIQELGGVIASSVVVLQVNYSCKVRIVSPTVKFHLKLLSNDTMGDHEFEIECSIMNSVIS